VSRVERRLAELGIELDAAKPPVANYLGTKRLGAQLLVSGRVSDLKGEVGSGVTCDEAYEAARHTAILLLSIVKADIGDLDLIISVDKVRGFVRSAPGFVDQPRVIDGASDLLVEVFDEAGRHARTATGAVQLPSGSAVQLDMVLTLSEPSEEGT
jgi:enamine deaminase RidA (YjgF/YER057c/UK114 family)